MNFIFADVIKETQKLVGKHDRIITHNENDIMKIQELYVRKNEIKDYYIFKLKKKNIPKPGTVHAGLIRVL